MTLVTLGLFALICLLGQASAGKNEFGEAIFFLGYGFLMVAGTIFAVRGFDSAFALTHWVSVPISFGGWMAISGLIGAFLFPGPGYKTSS